MIRERCFRTVLISPMVAPQARSARVVACFSASEMPGAGAIQFAEAPPETSTRTRSFAPAASASASMSLVPVSPASLGTGWPASTTRTTLVGHAYPVRVTTIPRTRSCGTTHSSSQYRSATCAMDAPALPAANMTKPFSSCGAGRCGRGQWAGWAAATAVRKRDSRKARAGVLTCKLLAGERAGKPTARRLCSPGKWMLDEIFAKGSCPWPLIRA